MNFLNSFINNPQANFDPLNFIGILVTVIASVYIFKSETSITLIKERHDKLIFPLFNTLEPILFGSVDVKILNDALDIIESNKNLIDGRLLEITYLCNQNPNQVNFISLCSYVNRLYDKSCHKLKLKSRSLTYRLNRNQYKNKLTLVFYFITYLVSSIFVFFVMLLLFFYLLAIGKNFFYTVNQQAQTILLVLMIIIGHLFIKHFDK